MDDLFDGQEDPVSKRLEAQQRHAQKVARCFGQLFGSALGKEGLTHLRNHLLGPVVLDRGSESTNETIRRDALRDVYFWIEGLARIGVDHDTEAG